MAMDDESFAVRWKTQIKPKDILGVLSIARISDYFVTEPKAVLPSSSPIDWSKPEYASSKVNWRAEVPELERRRLETQVLPKTSYRELVEESYRPEEVMDIVHDHIWNMVNTHLGTNAHTFPELVEQLGIMRYGHRPRIADTFCGSGQIPFEAARLGSDVFASDINPVACMLTWGALNIVGGSSENQNAIANRQAALLANVQRDLDHLAIETDGKGWRAKAFLYCVEVRCPTTGWLVPLLPSQLISGGHKAYVELIPNPSRKRYEIEVHYAESETELAKAALGTVRSDGKGQDAYLYHVVDGKEIRTKISTLRGDYHKDDGGNGNRLRQWEKHDFKPLTDDLFRRDFTPCCGHDLKQKEKV